ncbi:hypothetical protein P4647_03575 [Peribacillus frigoritolerans]|uniref:hypothetical protein n=1 Tax=Peribacillus frigoritolerans TaxID=450367 RepID=UPI002E241F89|nr:hypothetical protein [Peribacillus frigoritolerans]
MDQKIERFIDNTLSNISSQLLWTNNIVGFILIILGLIFMIKKSKKRNLKTLGLVSVGLGAVAIVSGLLQM